MATDPVCGMEVDEALSEHVLEYGGKKYYFCSPGCKSTFEGNPEKFAPAEAVVETPPPTETVEEKKKPWWKFW